MMKMFEKIGEYLESKYTAQPAKPDDNDFEGEFEPMDTAKLPHLTSDNSHYISGRSVQVIIRELKERLNAVQVNRCAGESMGYQGSDALNGYIMREIEIGAALRELECKP
jgi:hypothetical protein